MSDVVKVDLNGRPLYWYLDEEFDREDANPDSLTSFIGMGIAALADVVDETVDWSRLSVVAAINDIRFIVYARQR